MQVNEAERLGNGSFSQEHKREEGHEICCEAKRPRGGTDDKEGDGGHQVYTDEDEIDWDAGTNYLDSYRVEWISIYGKRGGSFEDESKYTLLLDGTIQM